MTEHPANKINIAEILDFSLIDLKRSQISENEHEIKGTIASKAVKRLIKKLKKLDQKPDLNLLKNQLLIICTEKCLKDAKIKQLGHPSSPKDAAIERLDENKDFSFTTQVASMPDFEIPNLKDIDLVHPPNDVTEEEIQNEIQEQCWMHGKREEKTQSPNPGDEMLCRLTVTVKNETQPHYKEDNLIIKIPEKGTPLILKLKAMKINDDFFQSFKPTEKKIFEHNTTYGDFGILEESSVCLFEIEYKKLRSVTPSSVKDVLDIYGTQNEKILEQQIKLALKEKRQKDIENVLRKQALSYIHTEVDYVVPSLTKIAESDLIKSSYGKWLFKIGYKKETIEQKIAMKKHLFDQRSIKKAKRNILFNYLSSTGSNPSSEQVMVGIASMAQEHGERPENFREKLIKTNQLNAVMQNIHAKFLGDALVQKFNTQEISNQDWEKWSTDNKHVLNDPDF